MPVNIHGKQYYTVAERLKEARGQLKSITTEVIPNGGSVVVKATVVTNEGTFTGISAANPNKTIEKQSPYEVAETSAVGRALGFAGFGAIDDIASADEMVKAGVTKTVTQDDEPPMPLDDDVKVCSQHDEPIEMKQGESKSTGKKYWYHRNEEGKICFGTGYKD